MARFLAVTSIVALLFALPLAAETVEQGKINEGLHCTSDPTQSYSLYLPSTFSTDRRWPLLYIFDPRGRGTLAAEIFRPAAEKYGWMIISSNDTRSDGPPEPNAKALAALIPEAGRYPVDPKRVYMTGFSGGAILAFLVGIGNGDAIAGVIGCGGRFPDGWKKAPVKFAHWGTAGTSDFNYAEMRDIDSFLEKSGSAHRFEQFDGPHSSMPAPLAEEAVAWMELDAMRRGVRQRDDTVIAGLWQADVAAATTLESSSDRARVLRRWKSIESTFRGLRDVSEATAKVKALSGDKDVREAVKAETRWFEYEDQMVRQMGIAIGTLRREEAPVAMGRLTAELRIDELKKHAAASGIYESHAAERVLSSMYSQMSFYFYRDLAAAGRFDRAAQVLEIAELIRPGTPNVRYNLACALARTGDRKRALDSIEAAIEAGFSDAKLLREDTDLASLRNEPRFKAMVERVETLPAAAER